MANEIKVKKGDAVIGTGETVEITGVGPNKDVPKGTYQYATVDSKGTETSKYADVQAFKTNPIAVTSISLDKTAISGKPGDKGILNVTFAPTNATNKGFTFASSDATVCKVDNAGNWEMLKDGAADLTVTTADGAKKAVCKATVATPVIHPTGVTASPKTHSAEAGTAGSYTVAAAVAPTNANNKAVGYTITPATTGLTVSAAGKVDWTAAVPDGTYTTTVKTTDGGKTDTSVLTLTKKPDPEPEPPAGG